jgi:glycosyltransferase involved in cell wall biosynthesis
VEVVLKPKIVLSGVNLFEAGPLSVYQDALDELSRNFADQYEIIAFVHRKELFEIPGIEFREYPHVRSSWFRRLKFEYYDLRKISRTLDAYLWLSIHDITPKVYAKVRAVYCHNPAPFSSLKWMDLLHDWRYSAFVLFYRYLYRINIHQNDFVIVQQAWIRDRFRQMYGVENVVVAHPRVDEPSEISGEACGEARSKRGKFVFFFPAHPRVFKNVEILLEAAKLLENSSIEIWLTFSGDESRYAKKLVAQGRNLSNIKFLGRLTRTQVFERYEATDCLVFPSRLETWGLPISEFKRTGKPMLLADLPYAHETLGTYGRIQFFDPDSPKELASLMKELSIGQLQMGSVSAAPIASPFAAEWRELFQILLQPERSNSHF